MVRTSVALIGLAIASTSFPGLLRADEGEERALKVIEKLKGKFQRDDKTEGKPITSVVLDTSLARDTTLKELAGLVHLQELDLYSASVKDPGMKEIARFKELRELNLHGTDITDDGLKELAVLKKLEKLVVIQTNVTKAGVAELQKALPKCLILHK